jgi:hypothetical protein
LITLGYAGQDISEEDKNTVIAGILHVWGSSDGDDGGPWTELDGWL